jgi:hypothetical protein
MSLVMGLLIYVFSRGWVMSLAAPLTFGRFFLVCLVFT